MTLNKFFDKLRKKNRGQYRMLAFCIFLSVLLLTSFTVMYYGPTVQNFLPDGGDTRKMASLLMAVTAVGCVIFTLYASSLFFRYKSREYGIFLALGVEKKRLSRLLFRELALLMAGASLAGLVAAAPASWLLWRLFILFLVSTEEMRFRFGITGFLIGICFVLILALLLAFAGRGFIKRSNIMDILRTQHQPEMVKRIPAWTFAAGVVMIPMGLLITMGLPNLSVYVFGQSLPPIVNLFYVVTLAGVYLVLLNIVGQTRGAKNRKKFYKNMVSVSLMRFSARTTTRNMCVIVLLLFATIFSGFYAMMYLNSLGSMDTKNGKEFVMHYPAGEEQIMKEDIYETAEEYGIGLCDYSEIEGTDLVISYKYTDYEEDGGRYVPVSQDRAKTALFVSCSDYETLTGRDVEVEPGTYRTVTPTDHVENIWNFVDGLYGVYNPDTGAEKQLTFAGTLEYDSLASISEPYAYVISDRDHAQMTEGAKEVWREQIVMFNTTEPDSAYPFAKALYAMYVERAGDLSAHLRLYDRWEEQQAKSVGEEYMYGDPLSLDADDTQLLNDWRYAPQFLITILQERLQLISVYVMLCLYIFILSLATAAVMSYVRGVSVAEDNKDVFISLKKLGADAQYQKRILNSQLAKIFAYPGMLGLSIGILFSVFLCWMNDGRFVSWEMQTLGLLLIVAVLVLVFLYAVYTAARKKGEKIIGV